MILCPTCDAHECEVARPRCRMVESRLIDKLGESWECMAIVIAASRAFTGALDSRSKHTSGAIRVYLQRKTHTGAEEYLFFRTDPTGNDPSGSVPKGSMAIRQRQLSQHAPGRQTCENRQSSLLRPPILLRSLRILRHIHSPIAKLSRRFLPGVAAIAPSLIKTRLLLRTSTSALFAAGFRRSTTQQ